ncbi:UNVERIFIED_CONTAM: Vacuolar cation/proton exchanger 2 [Sesamum radiatum]|uniref:Vacuolar cation/proton exchanger 2 n=1 Tax=Sesamum radiatum TaxID=300843 RepID=A0AAW2T4D3_SESRA
MGSLAGKSTLDIEDLRLVSPQPIVGKTSSLEIAPQRSFLGPPTEDLGCKSILSSIFRSTKIALFSNKLNLLIPCGPLAILVDKLTNHHGWVFFLSLLGIIPLAERLGWATEQLAFYTGPTGFLLLPQLIPHAKTRNLLYLFEGLFIRACSFASMSCSELCAFWLRSLESTNGYWPQSISDHALIWMM